MKDKISAAKIEKRLKKIYRKLQKRSPRKAKLVGPPPSARTIQRIMANPTKYGL